MSDRGSRLHQILSTFSSKDWRGARKMLKAWYKESSDVGILFNHLFETYRKSKKVPIKLDQLHGTLLPDITRKSFLNVMSRLNVALEKYLVWLSIEENPQVYDLQLLEVYNSRGLYHLFDLRSKQSIRRISNNETLDLHSQSHLNRIEHMRLYSDNPIKQFDGQIQVKSLLKGLSSHVKVKALFYHLTSVTSG